MLSYEDKSKEIDVLLLKFRPKWHLSQLSWMDYSDVCQIIRLHIYNKWHLWDQKRPFTPWCNRVINHKIINLIRDHYGNYAKPCLRCPHFGGGDTCHITKSGATDSTCSIYNKWEKKKKAAYSIKLPESIDFLETYQEIGDKKVEIDYDKSQTLLHNKMKKHLSTIEWKVYKLVFILNKSEDEVAKIMNYKADHNDKTGVTRYKQLSKLRRKFIKVAKHILEQDHDII